ncbi:MAG TPA: M3 family metallopeptidase, partial [Polyangiaceae bacterium]|nr:M3 family metallopeptidase [Polyangiaceae bacterium]
AHPDEAVRNAARGCETKTDELVTGIWLDAELAKVIKAYAQKNEKLTPERARFLEHTLRDFRRNGIELPADKQKRLREINNELTELGQRFIAEISSSKGTISIKPEQLAGLPEEYKKAHPPGPDGKVVISTDYPDYYPFVTYAADRKLAKELYILFDNRGGDVNVSRLDKLLTLRTEKAKMLGYASWADYAIEPRMAKTASEVKAFLDRVSTAIGDPVERELKEFRSEHGRIAGNANKPLIPPDMYFLTDRLREKRYKLDSQELAKYFEINRVTKGLLDITARMYGIEYKPVKEKVWHPSVTTYEVLSGGKPIGKFYLDLFSRDDKYKHAAMFTIRTAKTLPDGTRQTPIASLVCNFPNPGEPMQHNQVVTYFHEFGHVLHHLLTETELASFAGTATVRDFVEAPSQMFEEWAWSRDVLDLFARHPQSNAKIPDALFEAMIRSRRFGLALSTQRQIFLAQLDMAYHTQEPGFDTTALLEKVHNQYFAFQYVKGTHFQSSFGHLIGYDAGYYGYQWALSLAHDVLGRFKTEGLLNPKVAADWRRLVLSRGGAAEERKMIEEFLGRPPTEAAYVTFLRGEGS